MTAPANLDWPPQPWVYGRRKDGSCYLSLGDPKQGRHMQFDAGESEDVACLMAASRDLYYALFGLLNVVATSQFEPDAGKPSILKDGITDKWMHAARLALSKARGETTSGN